jgi:hypothetical protein
MTCKYPKDKNMSNMESQERSISPHTLQEKDHKSSGASHVRMLISTKTTVQEASVVFGRKFASTLCKNLEMGLLCSTMM